MCNVENYFIYGLEITGVILNVNNHSGPNRLELSMYF